LGLITKNTKLPVEEEVGETCNMYGRNNEIDTESWLNAQTENSMWEKLPKWVDNTYKSRWQMN
jgi:hypothetical protein